MAGRQPSQETQSLAGFPSQFPISLHASPLVPFFVGEMEAAGIRGKDPCISHQGPLSSVGISPQCPLSSMSAVLWPHCDCCCQVYVLLILCSSVHMVTQCPCCSDARSTCPALSHSLTTVGSSKFTDITLHDPKRFLVSPTQHICPFPTSP